MNKSVNIYINVLEIIQRFLNSYVYLNFIQNSISNDSLNDYDTFVHLITCLIPFTPFIFLMSDFKTV